MKSFYRATFLLAAVSLGMILILTLLVVLVSSAFSQEHRHPTGVIPDAVGRMYDKWKIRPARTTSCCSRMDCYAVEAKMQGGVWFFRHRETGKWLPVPAERVEQDETAPDNPDGQNHVCASASGAVYCFLPGGGA